MSFAGLYLNTDGSTTYKSNTSGFGCAIISNDGKQIFGFSGYNSSGNATNHMAIYKSINTGATWSDPYWIYGIGNTAFNGGWSKGAVSSLDFQRVCVCANTGTFMTLDGGSTWFRSQYNFNDVAIATNTNTLYGTFNDQLYSTTDWQNYTLVNNNTGSGLNYNQTGGIRTICCSADGQIIYGSIEYNQVLKSINGGVNFGLVFSHPQTGGRGDLLNLTPLNRIACSADGQVVVGGIAGYRYVNLYGYGIVSTNGGKNWTNNNRGLGGRDHWQAVAVNPSGNTIFMAQFSDDTGYNNWDSLWFEVNNGTFIENINSFNNNPVLNSTTLQTNRTVWTASLSGNGSIAVLCDGFYSSSILRCTQPPNQPTVTVNSVPISVGGTYTVPARTKTVAVTATPTDGSALNYISGNNSLQDDLNTITINLTSPQGVVGNHNIYVMVLRNCFKEDTNILCYIDGEEKYIPVQTIKKGTLVKTCLNGYVPVHSIGHSMMYNPSNNLRGKNRLYKCTNEKYPQVTEELVMTGCHSILVDEVEITQEIREKTIALSGHEMLVTGDKCRLMTCLDERAEPYTEEGVFKIWHFALEHFDELMNYGVYANGLLVESCDINMMREHSGMELD
jgi:hypothetical protein